MAKHILEKQGEMQKPCGLNTVYHLKIRTPAKNLNNKICHKYDYIVIYNIPVKKLTY